MGEFRKQMNKVIDTLKIEKIKELEKQQEVLDNLKI